MPPYQTLSLLPACSGRRFFSTSLGGDRIMEIRAEHQELIAVAARSLHVPPESVTRELVRRYLEQSAAR